MNSDPVYLSAFFIYHQKYYEKKTNNPDSANEKIKKDPSSSF